MNVKLSLLIALAAFGSVNADTIRERLEKEKIAIDDSIEKKQAEFFLKYPQAKPGPHETLPLVQILDTSAQKDFLNEMVPFAFQLEFIENILACMDRSNSAEDCFCDVGFHLLQKQKLEKELGTEEELGTEKEILEKTMKILKSIRQKTAEIIFDSENGDSRT